MESLTRVGDIPSANAHLCRTKISPAPRQTPLRKDKGNFEMEKVAREKKKKEKKKKGKEKGGKAVYPSSHHGCMVF